MKKVIGAVLATVLASASAEAATNFVVNGSFEFGHDTGTSWKVFEEVAPWYTISGTGIEIQHNNVLGGADAQDGNYYVELDSDYNRGGDAEAAGTNTFMGQDVFLTAGVYELSFYYQPRTNNDDDNGIDFGLTGLFGGDISKTSGELPGWELVTQSFSVNADNSYQLYFGATGSENKLGGFIDNVAISAIPEPATWLMMIMGFGLVGAASRRRNKAIASLS